MIDFMNSFTNAFADTSECLDSFQCALLDYVKLVNAYGVLKSYGDGVGNSVKNS